MCSILENQFISDDRLDGVINESAEIVSYDQLSRRDIRGLVFHLLYAAQAHDYEESVQAIANTISRGFRIDIPNSSEVVAMAQAIVNDRDLLDEKYTPYLTNWRFDRISVSTKLVLRMAVWELDNTDMDQRIVINEAIELAKCFAEEDAYRFINGILDRLANQDNVDTQEN